MEWEALFGILCIRTQDLRKGWNTIDNDSPGYRAVNLTIAMSNEIPKSTNIVPRIIGSKYLDFIGKMK